MEFSVGVGALEATAGSESRPPDDAVAAIVAFKVAGARPTGFVSRSQAGDWRARTKGIRGMPDACKDNLELV
jgi:hypothetical protein